MAVTKEDALTGLAMAYEYALTLSGGPNHPMARELAIWMQRHWGGTGVTQIEAKRRARNADSKAPAQTETPRLTRFVHPKAAAKLGEQSGAVVERPQMAKLTPVPKRVEVPEEFMTPKPNPQLVFQATLPAPTESEKPAVEADTDQVLLAVQTMKPRAILSTFGEKKLTEILQTDFKVEEDEMPDSGAQKAALLKQLSAAKK